MSTPEIPGIVLMKSSLAVHESFVRSSLNHNHEDAGGSAEVVSPSAGVEFNYDGSIQTLKGLAFKGGIIRDHNGRNMFAFAEQVVMAH